MSEWWTYRPSDFVMYSARTYARLVERYNAEIWPIQLVAVAIGLAILWLAAFRPREGSRWICALLAIAWAWIGWAFHWQRFSEINTAAPYFAIAFFAQALLLVALGVVWPAAYREPRPWVRWVGLGLLAAAVVGWPPVQLGIGRAVAGVEVFGVMPGVTGVGTVGVCVLHHTRRAIAGSLIPALTCVAYAGICSPALVPSEVGTLIHVARAPSPDARLRIRSRHFTEARRVPDES